MKKNNMPLRAAGILLLATMLTTCMTAGTFAKYTTSGEAEDSARVAKFGVTIQADGTLFGEEYAKKDDGNGIIAYSADANTGTVQVAATGENVVAPGTKNETGLGFNIAGTPEVDVEVATSVDAKNIFLTAGTYGVMVKAEVDNTNFATYGDIYLFDTAAATYTKVDTATTAFDDTAEYYALEKAQTVAADYYPVVYTLTGDKTFNTGTTATDSLAKIEELLEGTGATTTYEANTDLAAEFGSSVITWEWAFDDDTTAGLNDVEDTLLGDIAAGDINIVKLTDNADVYAAPVDGEDYNLKTEFNMTLSVTQVD